MAAGHLTQREESGWQEDSLARRAFGDRRILCPHVTDGKLKSESGRGLVQTTSRAELEPECRSPDILASAWSNLCQPELEAPGQWGTQYLPVWTSPLCTWGWWSLPLYSLPESLPGPGGGTADPQRGPSLHPCSRPALREPVLRVQ